MTREAAAQMSLRFSFSTVLVAAVLSAAPVHAQGEKYGPGTIEASAQKAVASAQTSASPQCSAPSEFARLERPLTHTARLLAAGLPIRIVAIGSSSTAGAGASSPDASYPSRLAAELANRFPGHQITVLNRGVNGEDARDMLARFETTVIAERPDLVLWQVGTNTVLRDNPVAPTSSLIEKGIVQLKAAGADVILIDPQFAPRVIAKSALSRMIDLLHSKAKQYNVNLFQRFAVMRHWRERQGISFETFVSPDQLHMNDWSYACIAKVLSIAIAEAATRPVTSAAALPPR
jgi:lysophospholipase L1-like esterase